jgi:integrase
MAAMTRTRHPGIYKRGSRYVVRYRANGSHKSESARTLEDALKIKRMREADVTRGEFHDASLTMFRDFAEEWVERYQGRGRGFRESTRDEYRRSLEHYAFPYFAGRRISHVTPRDVSSFVAWLCDERKQAKHAHVLATARAHAEDGKLPPPLAADARRTLTDSTVRNIVNPVRACFRTAVHEGLIRHNPARDVALPSRPDLEADDEAEVRPLTRAQLAAFIGTVHRKHRTLFELLATTGLRISEAIALQWRHVQLDGSAPHVKVRRAIVRGRVHPPKTRHGRRDVPLDAALVSALRRRRADSEWSGDEDLVFANEVGKTMHVENLRRRFLAPVAEEVGAPWTGFHTFRHTCASMLFERGANAKQVQRWLGHHSASFTLDTYVHLLRDDAEVPLSLADELRSENKMGTEETQTGRNRDDALDVEPTPVAKPFAAPGRTTSGIAVGG